MATSVYFNGETLTIPGAYSAIDTSGMIVKAENSAKTIAIIGECNGGEPGAVQFFNNPSAARKVLKGGELLKACEKAWNPVSRSKSGVDIGGANVIACVRTNQATKSELTIEKDGEVQIKFQSKDWDETTNYQVKMEDGTLKGTKLITVYDQVGNVYEKQDNIGNICSIKYVGEEPFAKMVISKNDADKMYFQTFIGEDEDTAIKDIDLELDPTKFKTLKAFINELRAYENYELVTMHKYNSRLKVTDFDFMEAEMKDEFVRVTAVYADLKSKLEINSALIEIAEMNKECGEIENFDYQYMSGGTRGTSPASWVKFFDALSNFEISYIVPLTGDIAIHGELGSHVHEMSGSLGRERRAIVGGEIEETVNEAINRARQLAVLNEVDADRMQVIYGGFYDVNVNGDLELYPPYILAAQHAGRAAYLEDGEAATHDVYRMVAPEYKLERGELTNLLEGGVVPFEYVIGKNSTAQSYVRCVQDLTTDIMNTDTVHTERATGALADSINKEIRDALDELLTGKRTSVSDLTSAKNRVLSILADRQRKGHIIDYKDVYVSKTGTVTEVEYSVAPAEPNNFTLIVAHYYSESITAE